MTNLIFHGIKNRVYTDVYPIFAIVGNLMVLL